MSKFAKKSNKSKANNLTLKTEFISVTFNTKIDYYLLENISYFATTYVVKFKSKKQDLNNGFNT